MTESKTDIAPAAWQVTAATILCAMVDDYVTIMVYKDWSSICTWCNKYKGPAGARPSSKFSRGIKERVAKCQGPDCTYIIDYRNQLIKEEKE